MLDVEGDDENNNGIDELVVDNIDGTFSDRHSETGKLIGVNVIDDNLLQNYDSIFHHSFFPFIDTE